MKNTDKPSKAIFISGIDTDAGKTYATAFYAQKLIDQGLSVITQKFIQTGCTDSSEDIEAHRRLLGTGLLPEDTERLTAPIILTYPASAQLAARIDGCDIDLQKIEAASDELLKRYDIVLIEGAGGLMVPITDSYFAIDYLVEHQLPIVLTTNGRLGSINHTILSLEAIKARGLNLEAVIYNCYYDSDAMIADDTHAFIARYLERHFPHTEYLTMPSMKNL
ncbi:MAG: ATP-dependent dethiobiotin synthetase BioD [Muribaculaceae bacterium]|nr:ATP-dependent dethiobiotin synthetase BioD [Muribaculaceae bacterium]